MIYEYNTSLNLNGYDIPLDIKYRAEKGYKGDSINPPYDGEVKIIKMKIAGIPVGVALMESLGELLDFDELIENAFGEK